MNAFAHERVVVDGHGTGEGLTFTGLHLSDVASIQNQGTNDLDLEWFLFQNTPAGFTGNGKGFVFNAFKGFALG